MFWALSIAIIIAVLVSLTVYYGLSLVYREIGNVYPAEHEEDIVEAEFLDEDNDEYLDE